MKTYTVFLILAILLAGSVPTASAGPATQAYLVATTGPLTAAQVAQLRLAGANVKYVYQNFGGAAITISPKKIAKVRSLPFVTAVDEDTTFELASAGLKISTASYTPLPGTPWWLDSINAEKNTTYDGSGVWVAIVDMGFFPNWREFFNEESILTQYATSFIGADSKSKVNQWDAANDAHGMMLASLIIGYKLVDGILEGGFLEGYLTGGPGTYCVPGVAPGAKIIPIKACVWGVCKGSAVNAAIDYITGLKLANPDQPIVTLFAWGGFSFSALDKAAIDAALSAGVVIVSAAGNNTGNAGMTFPATYEPVISVGGGGWRDQWNEYPDKKWWLDDVPENFVDYVWIRDVSARQLPGQYLDVVLPTGVLVVPGLCVNTAQAGLGFLCVGRATPNDPAARYLYIFFHRTSLSAAVASGVVALMLQKNPALNNANASFGTLGKPTSWGAGTLEGLLEGSATDISPGTATVLYPPPIGPRSYCWEMPECPLEATGHGWVFIDDALAAVP
jgi:subtilisin family serine protease